MKVSKEERGTRERSCDEKFAFYDGRGMTTVPPTAFLKLNCLFFLFSSTNFCSDGIRKSVLATHCCNVGDTDPRKASTRQTSQVETLLVLFCFNLSRTGFSPVKHYLLNILFYQVICHDIASNWIVVMLELPAVM